MRGHNFYGMKLKFGSRNRRRREIDRELDQALSHRRIAGGRSIPMDADPEDLLYGDGGELDSAPLAEVPIDFQIR